jgi:hypothetical protein
MDTPKGTRAISGSPRQRPSALTETGHDVKAFSRILISDAMEVIGAPPISTLIAQDPERS